MKLYNTEMNSFFVFYIIYIVIGLAADAPVTFHTAHLVYNQIKYIQVISDKNILTCANMLEGIHWLYFGTTSVKSVNFKANSAFQRMTVQTWPNTVYCTNSNYQPAKYVTFTCPSNSENTWIGFTKNPSDKIELCEYEIYLAGSYNPTAGTYSVSYPVSTTRTDNTGIDKNDATCMKDFSIVDYYKITFSHPTTVGRVRLTAKTELKNVKISLLDSTGQTLHNCDSVTKISNRQSDFSCGTTANVKTVQIQNTASAVNQQDELCEVEAYNQPKILCKLPAAPLSGKWTLSSSNEQPIKESLLKGTSLKLNCNYGYKPNGAGTTITCLDNSSWSKIDASCVAIPCQLPPQVLNGKWTNAAANSSTEESEFAVGTSLELLCNSGFKVESSTNSIKCEFGGNWSARDNLASCITIPCQLPPQVLNGRWTNMAVNSSTEESEFAVGTSLELLCNRGFKVESSNNSIKCEFGGKWSATDNLASCISTSCQPPLRVPDGRWTNPNTISSQEENEFPLGTSLELFCNEGFKVEGTNNKITCAFGRSWYPKDDIASCSKSTCNLPAVPNGGHYTPAKNVYSKGDRVQYYCEEEYMISSEDGIVCEGDNEWKGEFPSCEKPAVREHASLSYKDLLNKNGIDDNYFTCIGDFALADSYIIELKRPTTVDKVRVTAKSELQHIEVYLMGSKYDMYQCDTTQEISDRETDFFCQKAYRAKSVQIKNKAPTGYQQDELCEVKIFHQSGALSTKGIDAYLHFSPKNDESAIDQDLFTCVKNFTQKESYVVTLKQPATVSGVRLATNSETKDMKIVLLDDAWEETECENESSKKGNQVTISCPVNYRTENVMIKNTGAVSSTQTELCEVEIFTKSEVLECSLDGFDIKPGNIIYDGNTAWLQCNRNYKTNPITCLGNNTWSDTSHFHCEEISCELPETPLFGQWINSETKESPSNETLQMGMNLELECYYGYTPSEAEATITCLRNTSWSKSNLLCVVKPCKEPPSYPGGKWINPITESSEEIEFTVGTSLELECDNGFKIVNTSSDKIKCVLGGFWAITDNIHGCKSSCESSFLDKPEEESAIGQYATLNFRTVSNRRGIDQSNSTCVEDFTLADGYLIQLKPSITVDRVRITSKSDFKELEVYLQDDNYALYRCDTIQEISDRQSDFICQTNYTMKAIQIRKRPSTIYEEDDLCEIEIFYESNDLTPNITDAYLYFDPKNDENGIDQDLSTCVESFPRTRTYVVSLRKPVTVTAVRLTTRSDVKDIKIILLDDAWKETKCEKKFIRKDKQITMSCARNYQTEHVMLKNTAGSILNQTELCEVEIFVKSEKK